VTGLPLSASQTAVSKVAVTRCAIIRRPLRARVVTLSLLLAVGCLASRPADSQPRPPFLWPLHEQLRHVLPQAASFSAREGNPPHFKAYGEALSAGTRTLIGVAFWTTDLQPLERGYDGPIKMLIGMDLTGALTHVLVVDHHEPYGYFSVEAPAFAPQFQGKSVRDGFRVGTDVDAVSRATITMTSATRAIRASARRMAREVLSAEVK
jgi:NosR/NirI family nitrous oxide reductase transcriptional regulator